MILYYAMGGGLGHLTRARAVLHTLGVEDRAQILTASRFADDPRVTGSVPVVKAPRVYVGGMAAYVAWLRELFDKFRPEELYLDTFPAGINGELCDFPPVREMPVHYVARLMRWDEYERLLKGEPPRLANAYVLEPLDRRHAQFIERQGGRSRTLVLRDPPCEPHRPACEMLGGLGGDGRPLWLIVHSGPAQEVSALISYAEELREVERVDARLALIAQRVPAGVPSEVTLVDCYPASLLFPLADRVISACGFNVMRQMRGRDGKHRFIPFARRFDDQFRRAARHGLGV
jgi:hypothetical protein